MRLRVVYLGMLGELSAKPLQRLLLAETAHLCAVVVPMVAPSAEPLRTLLPTTVSSRHTLSVVQPTLQHNISQLAHTHRIPVYEVNDLRHPQILETLQALQPDLLVVACFPFILPKRILALPTYGCFNLHPALLPKLRGPEPLFWVFHEGAHAGVTWHRMTARVDAGGIVAQTALALPDGIGYVAAERLCAQAGADLLVDWMRALAMGHAHPTQPQDERAASYAPCPSAADFIITPTWSAQRAFNFMRGVMALGQPSIQIDDQRFSVQEALAYQLGETMREAYLIEDERLWVRLADGMVQVHIERR